MSNHYNEQHNEQELENIQNNLVTKDRKLQAQGGLSTMLRE